MRTQEQINKIKTTEGLTSVSINKGATVFEPVSGGIVAASSLNRKQLKEYLRKGGNMSFKVNNTSRVVDSMIKLVADLGYSIDVIEKELMPWGATSYWAIIKK